MAKTIEFEHPHRRAHFDMFNNMARPHFNVCAPVRVTKLLSYVRERGVSFSPAVIYLLTDCANAIPQFRQRIRGGEVFQHDLVHASFTVRNDATEVFGFCDVPFEASFDRFVAAATSAIEARRIEPSLSDDPTNDGRLFMSALPWVAFTSVSHAMSDPPDSVPRITWGRYTTGPDGETQMPLSVQAHHALVDGFHIGRYFELIQERLDDPERFCAEGRAARPAHAMPKSTLGEAVRAVRDGDDDELMERGPAVLIEAGDTSETLLPKRQDMLGINPGRTEPIQASVFGKESVESKQKRLGALQNLVRPESQVFPLEKSGTNPSHKICIGRGTRNDVVVPDNSVSSLHAAILFDGDHYYLSDLQSSNGTIVNHEKVLAEPVILNDGDCLRFGGRVFYFLTHDAYVLFVQLQV